MLKIFALVSSIFSLVSTLFGDNEGIGYATSLEMKFNAELSFFLKFSNHFNWSRKTQIAKWEAPKKYLAPSPISVSLKAIHIASSEGSQLDISGYEKAIAERLEEKDALALLSAKQKKNYKFLFLL